MTAAGPPGAPEPSAATVIHAYLHEQITAIGALDPRVRRDEPDAVHQMRVAVRRLRSALATFRPLLERDDVAPVRRQLVWLADALGHARDAEVMRARLRALLSGLDPAVLERIGTAPVRALETALDERHRAARADLLAALGSRHYLRVQDALRGLDASPPWRPAAAGPARAVLPALVRREWLRLVRRVDAAGRATTQEDRDLRLHAARRAAKRVRYACDAVRTVIGPDAARLAAGAEELQDVLGEHQDSVVSRDLLEDLGGRPGAGEGDGGRLLAGLLAAEQARAAAAWDAFAPAWAAVRRPEVLRWLE
ncbi:CHAD domain-containing protein [Georgenia sp. SYP-B2076]|uniref:CHAD domain-containing protein n=1 Tax=Georgenia sp. SYP-B2076 TaxID=2495881 RepID=UPI0013DF1AD6|nr:CHAD domain-containing protein [Georgenia sp. SYP-B2076]